MRLPWFSSHHRDGAAEAPAPLDTSRFLDVVFSNLDGVAFRRARADVRDMAFISSGCRFLTGYQPEALIQGEISYDALLHPDDRLRVREVVKAALDYQQRYRIKYRLRTWEGDQKWVVERGMATMDERGGVVLEGIIEDITEAVIVQLQSAQSELKFRSIFENSAIGMFQTSPEGHYVSANQALASLYGFETPEGLIQQVGDISRGLYVDPSRRQEFKSRIDALGVVCDFESEIWRCDGSRIWISENAHAVRDPEGQLLYYEGTVIDVTARRRYEAELEFRATHDVLTGLPNRTLLQDRLGHAIASARRDGTRVPVAFIDLDNFKLINDSMGHPVGDQLLRSMADRLHESLREGDTVARYGGDEFVLILGQYSGVEATLHALERLRLRIAEPIVIGGHALRVACSMGVAIYPDDADNVDALLSHADSAMYQSKARGKGGVSFYSHDMERMSSERLALETALHNALSLDQIHVAYQPRVNRAGRAVACEALIRWTSSQGAVAPADFIPVAEEIGLIGELTDFVLIRACDDAMKFRGMMSGLSVSVNISTRMFSDGHLPLRIRAALAQSGLPAQRLELEITESLLAQSNDDVVRQLQDIRALGVRIALDDFGTGYCALSYLNQYPIDTLKVDRAFVTDCDVSPKTLALVNGIISLGNGLGLDVVVEGVEREQQFDALSRLGCTEFQGYFFARPMPFPEFVSWQPPDDRCTEHVA